MKSKGIGASLRQNTQEGWDYIKESKRYIGGSALLFFACIFIGFIFADSLTILNHLIADMRESVSGLQGTDLSTMIFFSNTRSAFFSLFLGIILGIFSVTNIILNGTLIGYVIHTLWIDGGILHVWKLFPHGIFELPALCISWGLGIKLGMFIFSKYEGKELKRRFIGSIKAFIFIVIPLLLIAGIIEGTLITLLT